MKRIPKKVIAFHRNPYNGVLQKWFGYGDRRLCGMRFMYTFWFKDSHYIDFSRRPCIRFKL